MFEIIYFLGFIRITNRYNTKSTVILILRRNLKEFYFETYNI